MARTTNLPLALSQVALSGLNHVLEQQPAMRDRMRAHAGRCIRIVVRGPLGTVQSDARIGPQGLLTVTSGEEPGVTLTLSLSVDAVFSGLGGGAEGLAPHLKVEGDVMLAAAVGEVAKSLRWDYEEDLSRVVGDVAAHRIGSVIRGFRTRGDAWRERSDAVLKRNLAGDDGPVVDQASFRAFADEIERVRDRIDRLESRRRARA
ncbi:MAG: SCP2 domain-containing protein [Lautropia sp.]